MLCSLKVPRRDYEAACQRKRKAEEENAELRLQLKKLKAENKTLTKQFDVIKSK
jgi:cell division protein FtsB